MPYAQNHYPFENRDYFEGNFPADFIAEALDQTRGWFYTLTILSAALFDKPAFRNCIVSGMLLAEDGRKMSKRLKNYPEPTEMVHTYGADALRLYLLNSPVMKGEEMRLTEEGIRQSLRDVIIPLWNAYSFFVTYANIDNWSPAAAASTTPVHRLDRWILSELQTLVQSINSEMEAYRLYRTVPAMVEFVGKLTNWYIRRSRRRFWKSDDDEDKLSAYATLYRVLVTFVKTLAPVLPFVSESIYRNLISTADSDEPESVHLCDMPQADDSLRNDALEVQMELAMKAVNLGRSLRNRHELKTRQPLQRLFLLPPHDEGRVEITEVADLIAEELNVKEVVIVEDESELSEVSYKPNFRALGPRFGSRMKEVTAFISGLSRQQIEALAAGEMMDVAGGQITSGDVEIQRREREDVIVAVDGNLCVGLDIHLTDQLILECSAREFVNRVQNMRKDAGLDVADRIRLWARGSAPAELAIETHLNYVASETLALEVTVGQLPDAALASRDWDVNGHDVTIALIKA
jgi:isoleucyl-tRNA synthetase